MARRYARVAQEEAAPVIPPLGLLADLPLLGAPFRSAVRSELIEAGCIINEKVQRDPAKKELVLGPATWMNAAAARAFLERAPHSGARLVLRAPGWSRMAGGPVERPVDAAVVPAGSAADAARRASLPPFVLDADEHDVSLAKGPETLDVAAPRHVACDVRSWADLLWLNLFGMTSRVRTLSKAKGIYLVLASAVKALSLNKWEIAGQLVERGKGCDIHPSAVVEASVIGPGVTIGPGAVVRGSIVHANAEIEELALVVGSVVGAKARVERQAMCKFTVLSNAAILGGTVQLSFFGEGASLRGGSYTLDRNLDDKPVRVTTADGSLVEAGPVLGAALGPRCMIGSGVWIGAGRGIPADVTVVRSPYDMLLRVGSNVPAGVYAVVDGTLAPVPGTSPKASKDSVGS